MSELAGDYFQHFWIVVEYNKKKYKNKIKLNKERKAKKKHKKNKNNKNRKI